MPKGLLVGQRHVLVALDSGDHERWMLGALRAMGKGEMRRFALSTWVKAVVERELEREGLGRVRGTEPISDAVER